ncbi:cation:dicarboxylase symporter family transporter [Dolosigranulum pigrum]|uniref:cation:dicarboxylate symporter family transporter n=1 Tax=Dolosigranulum pigrum TaxID=29394 RepID=UPI001BB7AA33|nr:cation:dicarboxylase symporter family transporter [Dolosigranulum pigrum]QTJ40790.1 cation:dicarboxylase symporter family transporter [Dolosigranulum pigrum]
MGIVIVLIIFAVLLYGLFILQQQHVGYTKRVFVGLTLGIVFGGMLQGLFGSGNAMVDEAIEWINIVGGGYVRFLQLLIMPLIFVSLVQSFTKIERNINIGKISTNVLGMLTITVMVASVVAIIVTLLFNLDGAEFTRKAGESMQFLDLQERQAQVANLSIPEQLLNYIPSNIFEDLANLRISSTISVVIFSVLLGTAYLGVNRKEPEYAKSFKHMIDTLHVIVMRIVTLVLRMAPFGIFAIMTRMTATLSIESLLDLGIFLVANYTAIFIMFMIHGIILLLHGLNPIQFFKKAGTALSFAFSSRSSAGTLPMNIATQTDALGVDSTTANFSATFGMSIGQNGCGGIYPAILAVIVAPTVGWDMSNPITWISIILAAAISSLGVAGVGGGGTFAALIAFNVLGLPIEIVGLMISIEPIIDMGRTALNVNGSIIAGVTSSKRLNLLDKSVYDDNSKQFVSDSTN